MYRRRSGGDTVCAALRSGGMEVTMNPRFFMSENGSALAMVLIFSTALLIMGTMLLAMTVKDSSIAMVQRDKIEHLYALESGAAAALALLESNPRRGDVQRDEFTGQVTGNPPDNYGEFMGYINPDNPEYGRYYLYFFHPGSEEYLNSPGHIQFSAKWPLHSIINRDDEFIRNPRPYYEPGGIFNPGPLLGSHQILVLVVAEHGYNYAHDKYMNVHAMEVVVENNPVFSYAVVARDRLVMKGVHREGALLQDDAPGIYGNVHLKGGLRLENNIYTSNNWIRCGPGPDGNFTETPLISHDYYGGPGCTFLDLSFQQGVLNLEYYDETAGTRGYNIYNAGNESGLRRVMQERSMIDWDFGEIYNAFYEQRDITVSGGTGGTFKILSPEANEWQLYFQQPANKGRIVHVDGNLSLEPAPGGNEDGAFFDFAGVLIVDGTLRLHHGNNDGHHLKGVIIAHRIEAVSIGSGSGVTGLGDDDGDNDGDNNEDDDVADTYTMKMAGLVVAGDSVHLKTIPGYNPADSIVRGTIITDELIMEGPAAKVYYSDPRGTAAGYEAPHAPYVADVPGYGYKVTAWFEPRIVD